MASRPWGRAMSVGDGEVLRAVMILSCCCVWWNDEDLFCNQSLKVSEEQKSYEAPILFARDALIEKLKNDDDGEVYLEISFYFYVEWLEDEVILGDN